MIELQRMHNGLWVDPDDQSTWLYHQWLLGETFTLHPQHQQQNPPANPPILAPTSREEVEMYVPHVVFGTSELMVGCLFSLAMYKSALGRVEGRDNGAEVVEMVGRLEKGDRMRAGHYKEWRTALEQSS